MTHEGRAAGWRGGNPSLLELGDRHRCLLVDIGRNEVRGSRDRIRATGRSACSASGAIADPRPRPASAARHISPSFVHPGPEPQFGSRLHRRGARTAPETRSRDDFGFRDAVVVGEAARCRRGARCWEREWPTNSLRGSRQGDHAQRVHRRVSISVAECHFAGMNGGDHGPRAHDDADDARSIKVGMEREPIWRDIHNRSSQGGESDRAAARRKADIGTPHAG